MNNCKNRLKCLTANYCFLKFSFTCSRLHWYWASSQLILLLVTYLYNLLVCVNGTQPSNPLVVDGKAVVVVVFVGGTDAQEHFLISLNSSQIAFSIFPSPLCFPFLWPCTNVIAMKRRQKKLKKFLSS